MDATDLEATARSLIGGGKGILAADESTGTIAKRLAEVDVVCDEGSRRAYRELLFTAPGIEAHIGGVILFDETLRQSVADGTPFGRLLASRGIIPGIKVDAGTAPLPGFPGESITEGLDGLPRRLAGYRGLGARFAKWRAVFALGDGLPSAGCVAANAEGLARYAAASQEAGLVPIVEPEVLMDGGHGIDRHEDATTRVLAEVFARLRSARVSLEGMLLKPNMVLSGGSCPVQAGPQQVAAATLRCLRRTVPAAVPGIVFLSGGQAPTQATANLAAMAVAGAQPWALSYSFGRALQEPVLEAWRGEPANAPEAQRLLLLRARLNGAARAGTWQPAMEPSA